MNNTPSPLVVQASKEQKESRFGQRQGNSEQYTRAVELLGKQAVDNHLKALRVGYTRVSLGDFIRNYEKKLK